jgi:lysophospholipase L1-like esterase
VNIFYDQDGNGLRDTDEPAVVPNVTVRIGGAEGVSALGTGRAELDGVVGGTDPVTLARLPPFYVQGAAMSLSVPQPTGVEVYVPAILPIGSNVPGLYMAFGDSITDGDGSYDNNGYRPILATKLQAGFKQGEINNQAIGGTRSKNGKNRIDEDLRNVAPAYVLILYGTNDWNDSECRDSFPCYTVDSLRSMIRSAKARSTLPVISTITPSNTGYDARTPPERNVWISDMNDLIRAMAKEEGAVLVDNYAAFMAQPDFHKLLFDHVHPNDAGYQIMAQEWFKGISLPAVAAASEAAAPPKPPRPPHSYGAPGWEIGPNEE